jgi:hypothetical protein
MSRPVLATLALVVAVGVAGCGGDEPAPSSKGTTPASATTPSSATTTSGGPGAGSTPRTIDGSELAKRVTDAMVAAKSGKIAITNAGSTGTGRFVIEGKATKAHMTMPFQGQSLEIITLGKVIYIKGIPNSTKPWVKVDPNAKDPLSQMMAQSLGQMESDPRALVRQLEGSTATVKSEDAGITTYEVAIEAAGTGTATSAPVTLTMSVDEKDLPHTMVATVGADEVKVEYSEWGSKVTVAAPPASQVGTFQMPTS